MKVSSKFTSLLLTAALALTPLQVYALEYKSSLRPISSRSAGRPAVSKSVQSELIDKQASIKKINELLWKWNFKILALSHKRIFLRGQGESTRSVLISLAAIIRDMRKQLPAFKGNISETAIKRLERAIELLDKRKKTGRKQKPRAPNESAANRLLTSVMLELGKAKERALKQRLDAERTKERVYPKGARWFVREQRYRPSKIWETSVLQYTDIPYDTLWEAFRALDHQIDSELLERRWLLQCIRLLDEVSISSLADADKERLNKDIDSMLARLRKIRVEDKRLARILLEASKILLDTDRTKQTRELLTMAKNLFKRRVAETERIVERLKSDRVAGLRREVDIKNVYLMDKTSKILRNLGQPHYFLTRKIVDEDFINGIGARYINEPDFVMFRDALNRIKNRLFSPRLVEAQDIEALVRFFTLFRDRIIVSKLTDAFMADYRDAYVAHLLNPQDQAASAAMDKEAERQGIFRQTFDRYVGEHKGVREGPRFYWTIFYQAAFVAPKIRRPQGRRPNPGFLRLSDAIMRVQAENVGIRPEGVGLLLMLKDEAAAAQPLVPLKSFCIITALNAAA